MAKEIDAINRVCTGVGRDAINRVYTGVRSFKFITFHSLLLTFDSALNSTALHLRRIHRLDSTVRGNVNQPLRHIRG